MTIRWQLHFFKEGATFCLTFTFNLTDRRCSGGAAPRQEIREQRRLPLPVRPQGRPEARLLDLRHLSGIPRRLPGQRQVLLELRGYTACKQTKLKKKSFKEKKGCHFPARQSSGGRGAVEFKISKMDLQHHLSCAERDFVRISNLSPDSSESGAETLCGHNGLGRTLV